MYVKEKSLNYRHPVRNKSNLGPNRLCWSIIRRFTFNLLVDKVAKCALLLMENNIRFSFVFIFSSDPWCIRHIHSLVQLKNKIHLFFYLYIFADHEEKWILTFFTTNEYTVQGLSLSINLAHIVRGSRWIGSFYPRWSTNVCIRNHHIYFINMTTNRQINRTFIKSFDQRFSVDCKRGAACAAGRCTHFTYKFFYGNPLSVIRNVTIYTWCK